MVAHGYVSTLPMIRVALNSSAVIGDCAMEVKGRIEASTPRYMGAEAPLKRMRAGSIASYGN